MTIPQQDNPWDRFAKDDPTFYIATRTRWRWNEEDAFWASGKRTADFVWSLCAPHIRGRRLAVEIGCGIGRLAVPMAKRFHDLRVVDASPFMLEKLRGRCAQSGCTNVYPYLDTEPWWDAPADFIYSALTFQHIVDDAVIERYVSQIAQCLHGAAFVQFDTRPVTLFAAWKRRLPDRVKPRVWRNGMERIRRRASDLRALFDRYGLVVVDERDPHSALHAFVLVR